MASKTTSRASRYGQINLGVASKAPTDAELAAEYDRRSAAEAAELYARVTARRGRKA